MPEPRKRRRAYRRAVDTIRFITDVFYIRNNGYLRTRDSDDEDETPRKTKKRRIIEDSDDEDEVIVISSDDEDRKSVLNVMQYDGFIPLEEDTNVSVQKFKFYDEIMDTDNEKRILSQMWQTPSRPIIDLINSKKMNFPRKGLIWDPCCGMGSILAHIKRRRPKIEVRGSDLGRHGHLADARYLKPEDFEGVTAIVTNPPYNHSIAKPILDNIFDNWERNNKSFSIYLLVKDSMIPLYFYNTKSKYPYPIILCPGTSRYKYVPVTYRKRLTNTPPFDTYWLYVPGN